MRGDLDEVRRRAAAREADDKARIIERIRASLGEHFSTSAFARWLGRHRNQPLGWIRSGSLRAVRLGGGRKFLIAAEDAAEFLARAYLEAAGDVVR